MYGPEVNKPGTFAYNCLLARRLVERGVRFMQIFHRGWDHHGTLPGDLPNQCRDIDQPCSGADSAISNSAVCSTTRWWSGAASSGARSTARAS